MRHLVWMLCTIALAATCHAQENHRESHRSLFRSGSLRLTKERYRSSPTAPTNQVTPQPNVTEAPSTTAIPTAAIPEASNATEVVILPKESKEEEEEKVVAKNTTADSPKAEKLFGQPDLRIHLLAQQNRQQQLALEAIRAATLTPTAFAPTQQFQQASVQDLQQLLSLMQQAQQGNQYSLYNVPQYGYGNVGGGLQSLYQQMNQYQPSPALFSPQLSQYGQQSQQSQQQQPYGNLLLPYNPPATPNYVFHNGAYHVQGSSNLPANIQGAPQIKFSVGTAIGPAVQEQPSQDVPAPPTGVFVMRPPQPSQPPPPQFANAVFQNQGGQSFAPQQIPPFGGQNQRPSFLPPQGQPSFGQSQGPFGQQQGQQLFGDPSSYSQQQQGPFDQSQGQSQFGKSQGQLPFGPSSQGQIPFRNSQGQATFVQSQGQGPIGQSQGQPPFGQTQQGQSPFGQAQEGQFTPFFPQRNTQEEIAQTQGQTQVVYPQRAVNHPFSRTPVFFPPQALKGGQKKEPEVAVEDNEVVKEVQEVKEVTDASRAIPSYSLIRG